MASVDTHVLLEQITKAQRACAEAPKRHPLGCLHQLWVMLSAKYEGKLPAHILQFVNENIEIPEDTSSLTDEAKTLIAWKLKSEIDRIVLSMLAFADNLMSKEISPDRREKLEVEQAFISACFLLANYHLEIPLKSATRDAWHRNYSNLLTAQKIIELINRTGMDATFAPLLELCRHLFVCECGHRQDEFDPWS
eukprot:a841608_35.p1 GENE.a841608_35~~a841608_35.p1  ORF type:complete len:203 (+),score=44.81 a841608_35:29-610(+)